jgi:xanthine dehydrogenase accessory factor
MESIFKKIVEVLNTVEVTALCTVVSTKGSTPLNAGAKMIVWENGKIFGTIGGGPLEKATIEEAIRVIKNKRPQLFVHDLKVQHQMCCGGFMEIYIEPLMSSKKLFMFGGGHVGKAVVKHALDLDFEITVIDSREEIFSDWTFTGYRKVTGDFPKVLPTLPYDNNTFIVIATLDHPTDNEVLAFCISKPHCYIGMIGSKKKVATMKENLISGGIATDEELSHVDMPIGLDINAVTADEIAISILAKLIREKNK